MLQPFRLLEPTTVGDAAADLNRLGERARLYAGGAELLLLLRHRLLEADHLVNIKRIPGMDRLDWSGDTLHIGATVTHARLEHDQSVWAQLPLLAQAESQVGNPRVRSQGTLGGNLCFADPHADPGTALLVHEAAVRVQGTGEARMLPLADFLVGTYETALEPDELLTEVQVAPLPPRWGHAYLRIERFHRPTLNVAAAVEWADGHLRSVRLAVGCVGPKPVRLHEIERQVQGATRPDAQKIVAEARDYLYEQLDPVDDLLGSAAYKIHLTRVLLSRAIEQAAAGEGYPRD